MFSRIALFYRPEAGEARRWAVRIRRWLGHYHPGIAIVERDPEAVIVLGGDGTVLAATRAYQRANPIILGFNLGTVGFLAAVRERKQFLPALERFLMGRYKVMKRMLLVATVMRGKKAIFTVYSLNDIVVQNPLGMVSLEVNIAGYPIQRIWGTGILVATATGSTAYNLSAHGPIVMPNIKCLIVTKLLDHNIPTPSIVVKRDKEVQIKVAGFRKRGLLTLTKTAAPVDVLLISDGETLFPLEEGDVVVAGRSRRLVKFAELEENYFFKSLQEKFAFR